MILSLLGFVAGAWLFQYQPRIPDPGLFAVYLSIVLCAVPLRWLRRPAWLVLGFAWAHGHAIWHVPEPLPDIDSGRPVWAAGRVVSLVDRDGARSRFVLVAESLEQDGRVHAGRWPLRVSWYRDAAGVAPGEGWRLHVRLRRPGGHANPGGFDYVRWLYQQGIAYTASVRRDPGNGRTAPATGAWLTRLRQHLADAVAARGEGAGQALLRALVIGDRGGFSDLHWQVFAATGTSHLVAISGLHVGLVAGLAGLLGAGAWRRMPQRCGRRPALQAGLLCGVLAALGYAALAGFAIPTQRALLMLAVAGAAWSAGLGRQPVLVLAAALALVVAWSPVAVLDAGLWLSFAAVAAILWVMLPGGGGGRWRRWVGLQLALGLALLPLLLLFFGRASLVSPLVNLLAIPWFSLVLVPLALLGTVVWLVVPQLGELAWQAWLWLGDWTFRALSLAGGWDRALIDWPLSEPALLPLAGGGVLLLLAPRGVPGRWLGLLLLLPLVTRVPDRPAPGAFELTLLDVGQGLSVVVRTARHVLVYDAGPRYRSGFDAGRAVVLPYLRRSGVSRIDRLVASHGDSDHAGGVPALARALPVGQLSSGEPAAVAGADPCVSGQAWHWDGVRFEVLWPPPGHGATGNNSSCVIRVDSGRHAALLTGDIEAEVERQLLAAGRPGPVGVVVAPHHGSLSSSSPAFVRTLSPDYVLYATGQDNRWRFPRPEVVSRWRWQGAMSWDTARDGAVQVRFEPGAPQPQVRGHRRRHYWQP